MFKLKQKHHNNVIGVVLVFLLLILNIFYTFSSAFIVDFEQVNVSWVCIFFTIINFKPATLTSYFKPAAKLMKSPSASFYNKSVEIQNSKQPFKPRSNKGLI